MNDVAPPKDAFAEMMTAAKDPWYTAVLYRAWLEHADPEEPLWHTPYFGQVVRVGTVEELFAKRKHEHERDAARKDKDLGFLAMLDTFGSDAVEWEVVSSKSGPRTAMQEFANAEEKRLIAAHGGVLHDMDEKLEQTLNLTEGGQGDARARWTNIDAKRRRAFNRFKVAMEAYVAEYKDALVPTKFVDEDGYRLGSQLHCFRRGRMWKGMPEEAAITAWAETLPKFAWNVQKTDEYRELLVQRSKDMWANASKEQRDERVRKIKVAMATDASKAKRSKITTDQIANESVETKAERERRKAETMATDASKAKRSKIGKDQWANASEETRVKWCAAFSEAQRRPEVRAKGIAKTRATMATDASKAKRSKIAMAQRENEWRVELARARQIAVPFEKSKRRRAEMRAASDDNSGRWKNLLLYMVSEDGQTIRRVDKEGMMRERNIVGPVVDPASPDAFDSD